MKLKIVAIILLLGFLQIILVESTNYLLNINKLIYLYFYNKFASNQIESYISSMNDFKYVSYIFIYISLILKLTIVSSILYVGTFFYIKTKIAFNQLLQIVLKAEFLFLIVSIIKIVWFYFFQTNYTLEDLQYFYPLSALNIVGYKGLDAWFIYPLQVLNLFELAYWIILAYYIGKMASPTKNGVISKYPIDFGLKIVATSYGSALLLWVVVVMFFTLNYS